MKVIVAMTTLIFLISLGLVYGTSDEAQGLFAKNCAACHGADASGTPVGPALKGSQWIKEASPEDLATVIAKGRSKGEKRFQDIPMDMPPFEAQFSPEQIKDLAAYLKSLAPAEAEKSPVEEEKSPAGEGLLGMELYLQKCAVCHGKEGAGTMSGPKMKDNEWIQGAVEGDVADVIAEGRLGAAKRYPEITGDMPQWKGQLTEEQISSLAVLVKEWKSIGVEMPQWDIGMVSFGLLFIVLLFVYIYKIT